MKAIRPIGKVIGRLVSIRRLSIFGTIIILIGGLIAVFGSWRTGPRETAFKGRFIREWLADLSATEAATRNNAKEALRQMGPQAEEFLVAELNLKDSLPKSKGIALVKMFSSSRHSPVSEDERHRRAIKALKLFRPYSKRVIQALNQHLLRTNTGITALNALIQVGESEPIGGEFVDSLAIALRSADVQVRRTAAASMCRVPASNPIAIRALETSLGDADKLVQKSAAFALTRIGTNSSIALPVCLKLLSQGDPELQSLAVESLIRFEIQAAGAVPMLIEAAKGGKIELKRRAVYALGQIRSNPAGVVPFLTNCLEDTDRVVRINALAALDAYGNEATNAIPSLIRVQATEDTEMQNAARRALRSVMGK